MKAKKTQHGGARQGSGRKPSGTAKVVYTTKLPAEMVDFLRSSGNAAAYLEGLIRADPAFSKMT